MATVVCKVRIWGLSASMLAWGCAADDGTMDESQGTEASSTAPTTDSMTSSPSTTAPGTTSSEESGEVSSGEPEESSSSSGGGSTSDAEDGSSSGSGTTGEAAFDEEFMWVADFLRNNCVKCHATNMNGALVLPAADISNEEIRLALDGVVANTGLLLVEPGDRNQSQTYLQITNEFGAIFPDEETDRFGAWIDAGAMYYAQ